MNWRNWLVISFNEPWMIERIIDNSINYRTSDLPSIIIHIGCIQLWDQIELICVESETKSWPKSNEWMVSLEVSARRRRRWVNEWTPMSELKMNEWIEIRIEWTRNWMDFGKPSQPSTRYLIEINSGHEFCSSCESEQ